MPVSIIENFQLGTNRPLDNRYVVNNIDDVSLYWYDGMLIYNASTNQLFIVKDTSTEQIVEIMDSSGNFVASTDASISSIVIKNNNQDVSINNIWTKFGYVDTSLLNLGIKNAAQDVSINAIWVNQLSQDVSIVNLRTKDTNIDTSLNNLWVNQLSQDASIVSIRNVNTSQDASIVVLRSVNTAQDASIVALRAKDANQDVSINQLRVYTDGSLNNRVRITGDTMTGNLTTPGLKVTNDVSIGRLLHFGTSTPASTTDGDLWVEPTTFNLMYKHPILSTDASSYDLTNRLLRTANDWINFPDVSTLDQGDRILIEDSGEGFTKKWISKDAFSTAITGGFGEYPAYADSLAISSTTSTTYQTKLTLTTDASAIATTYRIGWSFNLSNSNNSKTSLYRIQVDGTTTLAEETVAFASGGSYASYSGFQHLALSAGAHTIVISYARGNGGTASISGARLEFWRTGTG